MGLDFLRDQLLRFRKLLDDEERHHHTVRDNQYLEFLKARIAEFEDDFKREVHDLTDLNISTTER